MLRKGKMTLASLIALALGVGLVASVSAKPPDELVLQEWETYRTAAIAKVLTVPYGTDTAGLSFLFKVTPMSLDDDPLKAGKVPQVGKEADGMIEITFDGNEDDLFGARDAFGHVFYVRQSVDEDKLFTIDLYDFAGIFEYKITEIADYHKLENTDTVKEAITYTEVEYTVWVYVDECTDMTGHAGHSDAYHNDNNLFIAGIGALMSKDYDGEVMSELEFGKLNPTPTPGGNHDFSELVFPSFFTRTNGEDKPEVDSNWNLAISKTVTGALASKAQYFDFELTLLVASAVCVTATPEFCENENALTYKAYVVADDGANGYEVVTSADNYAGYNTSDGSITVPNRAPLEFSLKHGQTLVVVEVPVGTEYILREDGDPNYYSGAKITNNGGDPVDYPSTSKGAELVLCTTDDNILYVGEEPSRVDVINTRAETAITGLDLKMVPFLALALLAGIGIVAFGLLAAKKRRRARN